MNATLNNRFAVSTTSVASTRTKELFIQRKDLLERCNLCGFEKCLDVLHHHHHDEKGLPKLLGYTPLVSQVTSLVCILGGKLDLAQDFQRLFVQGFVNFFKRIFYMVHVLVCYKLCMIKRPETLLHKSNAERDSWMATVEQERLWDLCLPGTHNSHAYASCPTPFGTDWVLCQKMRVREQLEAGIRLLDLRISSKEYFGHGPACTTCLDTVARDVVAFLSTHPTEVVVCLVKANGNHFKIKDKEMTPVRLFYQALEKAIQQQTSSDRCRCDNNNISTEMPENEISSSRLKQKTVAELTGNGTVGKVVVDAWSHWEGSWHYTRSNGAREVGRKSREWVLPIGRKPKSTRKPRVLELIVTVDAGKTGKTIKLALIHSVESLNRGIHQENLLSPSIFSHVQGILLDYPNESQIQSIVSHNQDSSQQKEMYGSIEVQN